MAQKHHINGCEEAQMRGFEVIIMPLFVSYSLEFLCFIFVAEDSRKTHLKLSNHIHPSVARTNQHLRMSSYALFGDMLLLQGNLNLAVATDRFDSMMTHLCRITSTLESMSSRMNAVETRLSGSGELLVAIQATTPRISSEGLVSTTEPPSS
eukprot:gene12090-8316_t